LVAPLTPRSGLSNNDEQKHPNYCRQTKIPNPMASLKGPGEAQQHDGSALRIGIVHARWNTSTSLNHPTTRNIIADMSVAKL